MNVLVPLRLPGGGELSLTVLTSPRPATLPDLASPRRKKEPKPFSFPWRKEVDEKVWAAEREDRRRLRKARDSQKERYCDYYTVDWQQQRGCNLGVQIGGRVEAAGDPSVTTPRKGLLATQRSRDATLSSPRLQKFLSPTRHRSADKATG